MSLNMPNFIERGIVLKNISNKSVSENQKVLDRLAFLVGCVAIGLPIIMIFGATIGGSCFRDTLSHFYHAQFLGAIFVGLLFFIGAFLLVYSGDHWTQTWGSTVAGIGSFGVALFPTSGSGCEGKAEFLSRVFVNVTEKQGGLVVTEMDNCGHSFFNLFGGVSNYHAFGAGVVFIYLGLFCLISLRIVNPEKHGEKADLIPSKRKRNVLYFWCGIVILLCVALLGGKEFVFGDRLKWWDLWNLTFWVETLALWAFGLAWIIKGRIFDSLNDNVS